MYITEYNVDYSFDISEPGLDQVFRLLIHTYLTEEEVSD